MAPRRRARDKPRAKFIVDPTARLAHALRTGNACDASAAELAGGSLSCMRENIMSVGTGDKVASLRWMLSRGMPVDTLDPRGLSALMWASLHGKPATVQFLLDNGADPGLCGRRGTALDAAAVTPTRDCRCLRLLMDAAPESAWTGARLDETVLFGSLAAACALVVSGFASVRRASGAQSLGFAPDAVCRHSSFWTRATSPLARAGSSRCRPPSGTHGRCRRGRSGGRLSTSRQWR